jgi:UDP-N-acetylglucosamine acyltransferase
MGQNEVFVHPSATVHPRAQLDSGVWVGPNCVIAEKVTISKNTRLDAGAFVAGRTEIGEDCRIFPFAAIGIEPQDISYKDEETLTKIGNRNLIREYVTIHRGTVKGGGETTVGDNNFLMAYSHIAHDCRVGNSTVITNASSLAGHIIVEDNAYISAYVGIHQFCRIGKYSFIGAFSAIAQDVLPFCRVAGIRPSYHIYGLNSIALRREGFASERIKALKEMFKLIFYSDLNTSQAVERIQQEFPASADRDDLIRFIQSSQRGIIKKTSGQWDHELE